MQKISWLAFPFLFLMLTSAHAEDIAANPANYKSRISNLAPGDTLQLAGGFYPMLSIQGLNGKPGAWITISGPESGTPAIIEADSSGCCNTVEIQNSSFLTIRKLTINGEKVAGAFGLSAGGGTGNMVHDIVVEDCTFLNHDATQQTDAISTKTPTWNWVIRRNRIIGAGTGLYLGNSEGDCPFVAGLIEYNLVQDTMGYNMQIKWQKPRPNVAGMPTTPQKTIIRHNVFIKTASRDSPDGDRPNVLLGGFPDIGAGSQDLYEVYGNLFYYNPRESLIQASGRVSIHDNIFVGGNPQAIRMQDHDLPLQMAHIYNNTIYTYGSGIVFASRAREWDAVIGNLIFAATSTRGSIRNLWGNLAVPFAFASDYVAAPSMTLESMNFFPLKGKCRGAALDLTAFADEDDFERDFNGSPKGRKTVRGAYAGEGINPGWKLKDDIKDH